MFQTPPTQPEGNLVQWLQCTCVLTVTCPLRSGEELSTYGVMASAQTHLDFGGFPVLGFWLRGSRPTPSL